MQPIKKLRHVVCSYRHEIIYEHENFVWNTIRVKVRNIVLQIWLTQRMTTKNVDTESSVSLHVAASVNGSAIPQS